MLKNLWKMFNKCLELYVNRKNAVICEKNIKEELNIIQHFLYWEGDAFITKYKKVGLFSGIENRVAAT